MGMGGEVTRMIAAAAALSVAMLLSANASAGVFADDFSRCLVKSSSTEDQSVLIQWIFAAITLNPSIKPLSSITAEQRDALNKKTAVLFERLIFTDCHNEAVQAVKAEGPTAFETAFQTLGQVAAQGMMSNPAVSGGLSDLAKYMDRSKWDALNREIGAPSGQLPPPSDQLPQPR